jgi:hypothetical protein
MPHSVIILLLSITSKNLFNIKRRPDWTVDAIRIMVSVSHRNKLILSTVVSLIHFDGCPERYTNHTFYFDHTI